MQSIDVENKRQLVKDFGLRLFEQITALPKDIRPDDKVRTGIQIVVRVPNTRNLVMVSVKKPSELAKFFAVEKTVRTEVNIETTSQDSQDVKELRYAGCVSIETVGKDNLKKDLVHVSVSGLQAEEDVLIAIIILSRVVNASVDEVIQEIIAYGGALPRQLSKKRHYLKKLLDEYR